MAKAELTINIRDLEQVKAELESKDKRIAELEYKLENAVIPNKEYYVIVTNGWKKQVYGVAKVYQRLEDIYTYCTDNTIGCFSPLTQYGTFDTLEEDNERLKELKKEKYANNRRK